jgi:transcriptional regulator with XRE-family HTH domain
MTKQDQPHKAARQAARVTQQRIADRLGRHVATIKRMEKQPPEKLTVEELDAYIAETGFTQAQVLGRSPLPEPTAGGAA